MAGTGISGLSPAQLASLREPRPHDGIVRKVAAAANAQDSALNTATTPTNWFATGTYRWGVAFGLITLGLGGGAYHFLKGKRYAPTGLCVVGALVTGSMSYNRIHAVLEADGQQRREQGALAARDALGR